MITILLVIYLNSIKYYPVECQLFVVDWELFVGILIN